MKLDIHARPDLYADTSVPDPHQDTFARVFLGFWVYLMTDCILFATLFATYWILHGNTFGGPTSHEIFDLKTAFIETMILLFSSITCGFAILASLKDKTKQIILWLIASFLLGASFVAMELHEFNQLVQEGHSWSASAFLSAFFTLVGTHGLHVSLGLLWMGVMIVQVHFLGVTVDTFRRLAVFSLFWHFLDLVWIFIFTFVYLFGVI